jgi:prepilin-type N-terminal cleavage/methylation domain-containing protein
MRRKVASKRGFSLVELLVVLAIIALLISILLPLLGRAQAQAQLIKCESNLRQFGLACSMYENDHKLFLPYSNWGPTQAFNNVNAGWLYTTPLTSNQSDVTTGVLWQYLNTIEVYHCPLHRPQDSSLLGVGASNILTSYLMNGAINDFGASAPGSPSTGLPKAYLWKVSNFNWDDILMWEADERGSAAWNDGSSWPSETYNPSDPFYVGSGARHIKYLSVLSMDGHVESMSITDYWTLASSPLKNRLWCRCDTATGR